MNNSQLNIAIKRKQNIKEAFKKYHLESILYELWKIKGVLTPVQKAFTATIAIEYSEPSYGQELCMEKLGGDPIFFNSIHKFDSSYYFCQAFRTM